MTSIDVLALTAESFNNVVGGISDIVTIAAAAIGGSWAYFKFVKGRTFEPRLSVHLSAQWHVLADNKPAIQIRVRVTNIGASQVSLLQRGTGLTVAFPAGDQPNHPDDVVWKYVNLEETTRYRVFEILCEHQWIEPNETVSDDILLTPGCEPRVALIEAKLLWTKDPFRDQETETKSRENDVQVFARAIVAPDAQIAEAE